MGNKDFSAGPQADWSREATRNTLISPVDLRNWGIFYTRKDSNKASDFIRHMQSETRNMGINCQAPFRKELTNERIETLVQELRKSIDENVCICKEGLLKLQFHRYFSYFFYHGSCCE